MRTKSFLWSAAQVFALGIASGAIAQERTHKVVPDDYFSIANLTECAVAPDGEHIAYVELRWDKAADQRNADLWVVNRETRRPQRLTFDLANDTHPRWSADNHWVYFTSDRERGEADAPPYDGTTQVWRIGIDGTGLMPVTRIAEGIQQFRLSDDGKNLYYTVGHKVVADDWKELFETYASLQYGHGVSHFSQLWKLDLDSWRTKKLIDRERVIRDFAVAPDEKHIAMLTTPTEKLITNEGRSAVEVFDVAAATCTRLEDHLWRKQAPSPYGWLESLAWTKDSQALAFGISFDGYPSEVFVADFSGPQTAIGKLERAEEITLVPDAGLAWRGASRDLLVRGEWRARAYVYAIKDAGTTTQGETVNLTPGDVCVDRFAVLPGGDALALIMGDTQHAADLYLAPATGGSAAYEQITNVNPQIDTWKLPQMRLVTWNSPDGTEVAGILELPHDYHPGKPLPMVVEIHGGPTAASMFRMRFWIYGRVLMPAQGYALLSPNYRGSTGYGDTFLTDLVGRKNDIDVTDILAGVDTMVERGIADPDRLAVMGWSNGGFLTNCLITKTDRFKAASSGAGVLDVTMQWAVEDTPGHVINFQKGLPWSNPAQMIKSSPLYALDKVRTPTLIHVGEKDHRCPPAHSKALYRALHEYLHIPTELVIYPGEGHGLTKYQHRKAKMEWDLRWFKRYLKASETATSPPDQET